MRLFVVPALLCFLEYCSDECFIDADLSTYRACKTFLIPSFSLSKLRFPTLTFTIILLLDSTHGRSLLNCPSLVQM
jgi:hypothetical protein